MKNEKIRHSLLFRGMTDAEFEECLRDLSARERSYEKDEIILAAGSTTDRMGVVLSGGVTIERNDVWGNCTILNHVGEGGFFAETYAMLKDEILLVDVRAAADTRILLLRTGALAAGASPASAWQQKLFSNLMTISMQKNLALSARSFHTAPKTIRGRVLSYLNTVALRKHTQEFDIPFSRQQLADYLNVERTALSKELGKMQAEGILRCRRSHFLLLA